uniref:MORC family CW-type zinc finger protein 1 isoform X3 n=1 Tax=Pogona vitticeps TaxID=103695 RepID=A0A6J0UMS0_9SAUR
MSEATRYGALCRAKLRLEYLHANSTTHDFLFGAVAELIDNSRDAGATRLDIFTVNKENVQGGFMLCFLDDGCGMSPREATDLIYFGRSSKRANPKMIGHFGNGLKSGSMRIGKDFILFTKKESTMTCLLFSQTFCETEGLTEVVVPIPSWSGHTKNPITDDSEKFATQLCIICKYSPFKSEAELMKQFDGIYGKTGTLLVVYNLKLSVTGETELDNQTDEVDLLIAGAPENFPEQRSLRAYTAILYFDPQMRIFIQAQKVETKRLPYCFYRPRMYPYISSSFREVAMKKLEETEMEVKAAEDAVKEAKGMLKHVQDSHLYKDNEHALRDALENENRMREKLDDIQRNLRRPKKLFLIFGMNIQNRSQDGMLIYSNNRLIRMFEKVGPQKNIGSCFGAGAVGIVDVPTEIMEPTHNKQAFANVKEYNCLLKAMGNCLAQYWKDIGISQKGEKAFWSDFGYQSNKWNEKASETLQYKRRRAVEIPDIVQCDMCLKWRLVSLDSDINHRGSHDIWNCAKSPNTWENKCSAPEHLPSVPLGTFNPTLSLNHRQKAIIESIQEHKKRLEDLQSQKLQLIPPHTVASCTKTPQEKACQRNTLRKDPSPACRRSIKSRRNKRSIQQWSHDKLPPVKEKRPSDRRQQPCQEEKRIPFVPEERKDLILPKVLCFEEQNEQPYCEEPEVIKIETDSEPEIISIILSESETEDFPTSEGCKDFSFMHKDKQEPCDENGDSFLSISSCVNVEKNFTKKGSISASVETSEEDSKGQVLVAAQKSEAAGSHTQICQHIPETKLIEALTSHIKETLLYILPESGISREQLASMGPEDILLMFKVKGDLEENKTNTLYVNQLFLQYEERITKKLQSIQQHGLQAVSAIETKLSLCDLQIKATQEKLEHLRGKVAQLLLKIHPHFLISNLEDVDSFLEESLNLDKASMPECASTSGISGLSR